TWPADFNETGGGNFQDLLLRFLNESNHLHHPGYMGHQVTSPLPFAAICDLAASLLNNAPGVYEMGPVGTVMERSLIGWMGKMLGFHEKPDGFFTSGGTLANLTALLAARQANVAQDVWKEGN